MAMQICKVLPGAHEGVVTSMAYDVARGNLFTAAKHCDIKCWSTRLEGGALVATLRGHTGWVTCITFCEGLSLLVSGSVDGNVILWDDRFKILQQLDLKAPIHSLAWNNRHGTLGIGQNPAMQYFTLDPEEVSMQRRVRHREMNITGGSECPQPVHLKGRLRRGDLEQAKLYRKLHDKKHRTAPASGENGADLETNLAPDQLSRRPLLKERGPEMIGPQHGHTAAVTAICIADNGHVLSVSADRSICLFDVSRPLETLRKVENAHQHGIVSAALDYVNNWLVTGAFDGSVKVWSGDGKLLETFHGVADDVTRIAYVPFTHSYWQVGRFGHVQAYDARAPAAVTEYVQDANNLVGQEITDIFVPPYTDLLLAATQDRNVVIYQYNHYGPHRTFVEHKGYGEALLVAMIPIRQENLPDPAEGSSASPGTKQQQQSAASVQLACTAEPPRAQGGSSQLPDQKSAGVVAGNSAGQGQGAVSDADGAAAEAGAPAKREVIFTACATGVVHRWAMDTQRLCDFYEVEETYRVDDVNILALEYCPELNAVLAGGMGAFIKYISMDRKQRWDGESPLPDVLTGHTDSITSLVVLKDFVLASASFDQSIRFWDLHTMKEIEKGRKEEAHQAPISRLAYVAERDELVSVALENIAKVWDVRTPHNAKVKFTVETPGEISHMVWIPWRGHYLSCSDDGKIRFWDEQGNPTFQFSFNGDSVLSLLADEEARLVLMAMQDTKIRVFDLDDPVPKARYTGHTELVKGLGKLKGQNCYVSLSWDRSLKVWKGFRHSEATQKRFRRILNMRHYFTDSIMDIKVSEYEKANPRFRPQTLDSPFIKSMLLSLDMSKRHAGKVKDTKPKPGDLAQKLEKTLQELDVELLHDLEQQRVKQPRSDGSKGNSGSGRKQAAQPPDSSSDDPTRPKSATKPLKGKVSMAPVVAT